MNPLYFVTFLVITLIYVWTLYNIPIVVAGVRNLRSGKQKRKFSGGSQKSLPAISLIVPVKDEEKVVGRLLKALAKADYPQDKKEIVIVEDGSIDRTGEICRRFAEKHQSQVKLVRRSVSDGKPSALKEALKHVSGEIVAVLDADNVPEPDFLLRAASYFEGSSVAAVQGRLIAVNEDENILTKFVSQEEALRCEAYMRGKDVLGLFVPLTGSCYFVRRSVLDNVGGWNGEVLSEDMELAARLTKNGYKIRYASDVKSWQEYPATVSGFFKQRTRWFRGTMEVSLRYGSLLERPTKKSLDAEITLAGPFVLICCLIGYFATFSSLFIPMKPDLAFILLANITTLFTFLLLALAGIAMIFAEKPRKVSNLLWLPFIYCYWFIQNFVASYAFLQILLRRPRKWEKTTKTGKTTKHLATSEGCML
ncbi:MAG: glycosyltransferase family 2 protein [Candidatus Bathyarchaeota archaeon]|jgi:cellulose synthase/poly-beta-1,6-N-acetylglucosamine synthase-like glycosyltransferase